MPYGIKIKKAYTGKVLTAFLNFQIRNVRKVGSRVERVQTLQVKR